MSIITSERQIPEGYSLAECAVSGGDLRRYIQELLKITQGQLCLSIRFHRTDFLLPDKTGIGTKLEEQDLNRILEGKKSRYSPCLVTNYITYPEGDAVHAVLFDTEKSILEKYALAESCGVNLFLAEEQSVQKLLGDAT